MKRPGPLLVLAGLLGLILAGCLARPEITPLPPSPMLPAVPTLPATLPPPTETPPAEADSSTCIACHTDEATLRQLAVEPEKVEELSEGEG
jgi:hypothetical protein